MLDHPPALDLHVQLAAGYLPGRFFAFATGEAGPFDGVFTRSQFLNFFAPNIEMIFVQEDGAVGNGAGLILQVDF